MTTRDDDDICGPGKSFHAGTCACIGIEIGIQCRSADAHDSSDYQFQYFAVRRRRVLRNAAHSGLMALSIEMLEFSGTGLQAVPPATDNSSNRRSCALGTQTHGYACRGGWRSVCNVTADPRPIPTDLNCNKRFFHFKRMQSVGPTGASAHLTSPPAAHLAQHVCIAMSRISVRIECEAMPMFRVGKS